MTHLPQLAAFGDQHWHVAKRVAASRTSTVVTALDAAARPLEVAQMLGGVATESAARNAAELLDRAATWKAGNGVIMVNGNGAATNGSAPTKPGGRKKTGQKAAEA